MHEIDQHAAESAGASAQGSLAARQPYSRGGAAQYHHLQIVSGRQLQELQLATLGDPTAGNAELLAVVAAVTAVARFDMGNKQSSEPAPLSAAEHGFVVGDRVQTQWTVEEGGNDQWYPGTVSFARSRNAAIHAAPLLCHSVS